MTTGTTAEDALEAVRAPVDEALRVFLDRSRRDVAALDPFAAVLVDELDRLVAAGGKRLRPAFCVWGYRAVAADEPPAGDLASWPIVRAASALELLHTMALIHDDVIDETPERRGGPSSALALAEVAAERTAVDDPARFGRSAAIVAGDLAAVLADRLLSTSGFDDTALARAWVPYTEMRVRMGAGQLLDVAGLGDDPERSRLVARLKGGSYTIEGPLAVGASLAGAGPPALEALAAFGGPLGEAFQLRDDVLDADRASSATTGDVDALVGEARAALAGGPLRPVAVDALDALARSVSIG
jgi:geranylgeranyl diphosphate synthase type I